MTQRFRVFLFVLIPVVVILDQWTKWLVLNEPRFNALNCLDRTQRCGQIEISGIFDLSMVWNRGISFGIGQSEGVMRWVLVALTIGIAIGFAVWLFRVGRHWTGLALALVVGGAIGNVIDRVMFGAVVDFLDFSGIWRPYFFNYVFNVADAAISVGAVLLFVDQFLMSRSEDTAGTDVDK
ncbi:signal peptidase II [Hyphomonas sp. FCG-A18]|jgi:signal peptidase II|uniref:signal peptidase II n=1 Tax=Hyphomonas sp. FCG-A18 TaxID=3080019 RepID=UPI002B2C9052|nr:signal peptidase II [Hyphomonas sp. FCG-A18]